MSEEWRMLSEFPDYAVSSMGRVQRIIPGRRNHACRVLSPWMGNHGYPCVSLARGGSIHKRLVHRLVCETFHGPAPTLFHQVAHGDGSRTNASASNLRWATRSENTEDSRTHGTMALGARHGRTVSPEKTPRGESHGHAKLTESDVKVIRSSPRVTGSGRGLAAAYGVSPSIISQIRSGKIWKHI